MKAEYPRYQMTFQVPGRPTQTIWHPIAPAGILYDNGFADVRIGGRVMEEDGSERDITDKERQQIVDIADDYSASK